MKTGIKLSLLSFGVLIAFYLIFYEAIWRWSICRQYCSPGHSLMVTRKTGNSAARDAYASPGQKGVLKQLAGPGRHFYNPWDYEVEHLDHVWIPGGKVGVIKNEIGTDLPQGRFLANPDEKGTQWEVLTPGEWRINRFGRSVELAPAVIVKPGYVGVQTLREGDNKGILDEVLHPGLYHINPRERRIDIVEIGYREWSVVTQRSDRSGDNGVRRNSGVSFPLADGKEMHLDFTVIWGVFPKEAPRIIREYGTVKMVESKVIEPQVLSICKNLGSNLTTMQFIEGDTREQFQRNVTTALQEMGEEKGIHILIALVKGFHPAEDIKETIQKRMLAEEEKKTLKIEEQTDVVRAQLEQAQRMVDIALRDYDAETAAVIATEREAGLKKAAEIKARADREVAGFRMQKAEVSATALKISGQASADVIEAKRKADAQKLEMHITAFGGAPAFNLFTFAENLPDDLRIRYRYSGPGTLWTDSDKDLKDLSAKKLLHHLGRQGTPPRMGE